MSAAARHLTVTDVSTGYRGRPVIRRLTLAPLVSGAVTALVGPNAAGKSTLLRALAGLLPATGALLLDGIDLMRLGLSERAAHVAFMPQTLPHGAVLTVLESVISALRAKPPAGFGGDATERAVAVLERLGIAPLALEPLDRLSGGQRQLASLAQAIVRAPSVLLLDEPTSALDLRHQIDVMQVLRQLADEGCLIVMVVHDLAMAARWADHLVVLHDGALHGEGPAAQVVTPAMLAQVYGVRARVDTGVAGHLHISIEDVIDAPVGQGGAA